MRNLFIYFIMSAFAKQSFLNYKHRIKSGYHWSAHSAPLVRSFIKGISSHFKNTQRRRYNWIGDRVMLHVPRQLLEKLCTFTIIFTL